MVSIFSFNFRKESKHTNFPKYFIIPLIKKKFSKAYLMLLTYIINQISKHTLEVQMWSTLHGNKSITTLPKTLPKTQIRSISYFLCFPPLSLHPPLYHLHFLSLADNQLLPDTSIWARDDPQRGKEGTEVDKRWRKKCRQDGGREWMDVTRRSGS